MSLFFDLKRDDGIDQNTTVFPEQCFGDESCDMNRYIVGPPGPPGPIGPTGATGPQGPMGLPGSSGPLVVVTETSMIPVGQLYTFVNASGDTNQTLPPISSVLVGGITTAYVIYNYSDFPVTVLGSGSDQVQFESSLVISFDEDSVTFLPTPLGWVII